MKSFHEWLAETSEYQEVMVCEASLTRMMAHVNQPFGILSGYRKNNADGSPRTREQNILANRAIRSKLNGMSMGVHQLIGHWRECKDPDIAYQECPEDMKTDVIERSYFVPKPADMPIGDFERTIVGLAREAQQDGVLLSDGKIVRAVYTKGGEDVIGTTKMGLGKIGQGYSQHILKQNVPFVFEGFEQMHSSIARQGAAKGGLKLPPLDEAYKTIQGKSLN